MKNLIYALLLVIPVLSMAEEKVVPLKPLTLTNQLKATSYKDIFFSGQPTEEQMKELRKQGFATVISLRDSSENVGFDEAALANANGLNFVRVPVSGAKAMTPEKVDEITKAVVQHRSQGRVLVHCASGGRVGLWAGAHFKKDHGYSEADAMKVATEIGMPERFNSSLKTLMKDSKPSKK